MSTFTQKIILIFLLSLLLAHNVTSKVTVTVFNNLSGNLNLNLHCKSKDDDLGFHLLHQGQSYSWSFGNKVFGGTLFYCSVEWSGKLHYFDAYIQDRDQYKCFNCVWHIKQSGPCRVQQDQKPDECFPWNKE
jgi:hypothetical protein